jgi:hypothetical protein
MSNETKILKNKKEEKKNRTENDKTMQEYKFYQQ